MQTTRNMRRQLAPALIVWAASLTAACGTQTLDERVSPWVAAVHHGTYASNPSVVALVLRRGHCDDSTPTLLCSAVLVTDRVLLTAAHCAKGLVRGSLEARFGDGPTSDPSRYRVIIASAVHPAYDPALDDNDIALLWLDAPAPAFAQPATIADLSLADSSTTAWVAGFGETDNADASPAEELGGNVVIQAVKAATLSYSAAPAMTCSGDSGGPIFVIRNGNWELAGLTTSGDSACEQLGIAVRVDTHRTTFIEPALAKPITLPNIAPQDACFANCHSDSDCPFDLLCQAQDSGDSHCELRDKPMSSLAGPCTGDADCGEGACVPVGGECRCSTRCADSPNNASLTKASSAASCSTLPQARGRDYLVCATMLLLMGKLRRSRKALRGLSCSR